MVRGNKYAHAADANEDAEDLGDVVSYAEEEERHDDHHHDGPEVDQLGAEHGRVSVCQHDEVVAFDVAEGKDDVFPAITPYQAAPALEPVPVDRVRGEDAGQQDVVEQGLEGGDSPFLLAEQAGKSACRGIGDGEQLTVGELV